MFSESPLAAYDHLNVHCLSKEQRSENGPVIRANLIVMKSAGQETSENYNGCDYGEYQRRYCESIGYIIELSIIADQGHGGAKVLVEHSYACIVKIKEKREEVIDDDGSKFYEIQRATARI